LEKREGHAGWGNQLLNQNGPPNFPEEKSDNVEVGG
jgi:hypothetical protein